MFVLVALTLAAGTLFYWQIEKWSLLDAFYFSSITLTSVGYGDLAPQVGAGKVFTVFYVFGGIGIIVGFVNAVARASVEQREGRGDSSVVADLPNRIRETGSFRSARDPTSSETVLDRAQRVCLFG